MTDTSSRLALPLIKPSQAQKHVTHNEALQILDGLVQAVVEETDAIIPPLEPVEGALYALGTTPSDAWTGEGGHLALRAGGGWMFFIPREGWRAWDKTAGILKVYSGGDWASLEPDFDNLDGVGIGTTADATNKLALASDASLLSHDGAGHQVKVNKAGDTDTASLLFQSNWTGHAELGLAGDTDFSIKVSGDGTSWQDAMRVTAATGHVAFPNNVTLTGGSITGITDLAIADGGTGASSASAARGNLGLGSAATTNVSDYATAAQGMLADSAVQPGDHATLGKLVIGNIGTSETDLKLTGSAILGAESGLNFTMEPGGVWRWLADVTDADDGITGGTEIMRIDTEGPLVKTNLRVGSGGAYDLKIKGSTSTAISVGGTGAAAVLSTYGTGDGSAHFGIEIPSNDGNDGFYVATDADNDGVVDTLAMKINAAGQVGLGTTNPAATLDINGDMKLTETLTICNGTAPGASIANGVLLYAEDVSGSSELRVRDEAGNVTTLSPHNFATVPGGASEPGAWAHYSEFDSPEGRKAINVDMLRLARLLEEMTGETLVHISPL